jgi:hypothetical protein
MGLSSAKFSRHRDLNVSHRACPNAIYMWYVRQCRREVFRCYSTFLSSCLPTPLPFHPHSCQPFRASAILGPPILSQAVTRSTKSRGVLRSLPTSRKGTLRCNRLVSEKARYWECRFSAFLSFSLSLSLSHGFPRYNVDSENGNLVNILPTVTSIQRGARDMMRYMQVHSASMASCFRQIFPAGIPKTQQTIISQQLRGKIHLRRDSPE